MVCAIACQDSNNTKILRLMNETLDLRWNGRLGAALTPRFNELAIEMREAFHSAICMLSQRHGQRLDWWLSSALSRNIFASPLFYRLCAIQLAREHFINGGRPTHVLVDSRVLRDLVKNAAAEAGQSPVIEVCSVSPPPFIVQSTGLFLRALWLWILVRVLTRNTVAKIKEPLILIDTFVSPGFEQSDRYYPGLWESLNATEHERVRSVPTLYGYSPARYVLALRRLCSCGHDRWLFREQFLRIRDLGYAALWWWRARRLIPSQVEVAGVDLGLLVREELSERRDLGAAFTGILNMRFFQRLSERGVALSSAIDWYENQPVDRGWNAGLNRYYPHAETLGYQGYVVTPHYLVMYPLECERAAGLLPKTIGVMGQGYVEERRQYCPQLIVKAVPALRFSHVHESSGPNNVDGLPVVAVALPKDEALAADIVDVLCREACREADWDWRVKVHPTHSARRIKTWKAGMPDNVILFSGTLDSLLDEANVLMSAASSVCMEAVARGVCTVIVAGNRGFIQNPIPTEVDHRLWRLYQFDDDLISMVLELLSFLQSDIDSVHAAATMVSEHYFKPVTRAGVHEMLGL